MRNLYSAVTLVAFIVLATACSKSNNKAVQPKSIIGYWSGKYGGAYTYPTSGYHFLFRSDGTVRVYDGTDTASSGVAEGTYTFQDSTVMTNYSYGGGSAYSTYAIVNSTYTSMQGTWGQEPNISGMFFADKQ